MQTTIFLEHFATIRCSDRLGYRRGNEVQSQFRVYAKFRKLIRFLTTTTIFVVSIATSFSVPAYGQHQTSTSEAAKNELFKPHLQWSGQLRERATFLSAIDYDRNNTNTGTAWSQRFRLQGDAYLTPWLRARSSIVSALKEGGEFSPVERNVLDFQEAFIELGRETASLRIGRQELQLGSQRLIGVREGTNVRRNWDGVKAQINYENLTIEAFALQLVDPEEGIFDDGGNEGRKLAGIYATVPVFLGSIDLYYLYAEFDDRVTIEGVGDERRHSIGVRAFGQHGSWFWDTEAVYQFGRFEDDNIHSWTVAANVGHRWSDLTWEPEFTLSTNVASGDSYLGDSKLGTFNALFPRGNYFSENALLGPSNFFNIHPQIKIRTNANLSVFAGVNLYWRLETSDAVYGPAGNILRQPLGSNERFVDISVSAGVEWEAKENLFFSFTYTHSEPQTFIEETGPDNPIDFLEFTISAKF